MPKTVFTTLAVVVAITGTAQTALAVDCRKPDEQAVLRSIESRGDAILFDYHPSELSNDFTMEYLNCRTKAAISVDVSNSSRKSGRAREVFRTAIESPAAYSGTEVIKALKDRGLKATSGKLDETVCGCWDKVLKKSSSKWGKYE